MQNSFLIYADYEEHFKLLEDDERGKLIMAIFAFNRGENLIDTLNPAGKMALSFIQKQMQRDANTYEQSKLSRSEAGKKGMEARWGKKKNNNVITNDNKNNNVIDVITEDNSTITSNNNNNYNVNVNVNEDVNVNADVKKKIPAVLTDNEIVAYVRASIINETICNKFLDYVSSRKAMGKKYAIKTQATLDLNIRNLKKWAKTVEEALEILDYSIANGYQGLFNVLEKKQTAKQPIIENKKQIVSSEEADAWKDS